MLISGFKGLKKKRKQNRSGLLNITCGANQETENNQNHVCFQKKVCYGQHTYLYAQCLLNHIAQNTDGGNKLVRISQELQKRAVER